MNEQLRTALDRALKNDHSSFYRDLYGTTEMNSWDTIPLLTREQIAAVPFTERLFIPRENVRLILFTSGTSGRGILAIPRTRQRSGPVLFQHARAILGFRAGLEVDTHEQIPLIYGDVTALDESARLAAEAHIDALDASPPVVIECAKYLAKYMDLSNIRFVAVHNERCTLLQYDAIKRLYPNARIENWLGMVELPGYIAFSPHTINPAHPLAVETGEHMFLESVREDGAAAGVNETGYLIVTTLDRQSAFPLVRYKTGDEVRVLCEEPFTFELLGRPGDGRVRIPGGELVSEEIERAIRAVASMQVIDFESSVEEIPGETIQTRLTLSLQTTIEESEFPALAEKISETLRVNQERTYIDGVREGLYASLICRRLDHQNRKRRRLQDMRT